MQRAVSMALELWRSCRCEQLALRLELATEPTPGADIPHFEAPAFARWWLERCAARRSRDVPLLVRSLAPAASPLFLSQLEGLARFRADPRLANGLRAALELHAAMDLAAPRFRPLWQRVFSLLAAMGDPRTRGWLPQLVEAQRHSTPAHRRWLQWQVTRVTGALPLSVPPREPVHLPAPPPPLAVTSPEERLVLADQLSARGDPLGEFLVLQAVEADARLAPEQSARVRALVQTHGRRWLGALTVALRPDGLRFERGAVAAGTLSGTHALRLHGDPAWSGVRELDLRAMQHTDDAALWRFLTHPVFARLEALRSVPLSLAEPLRRGPVPFRLRVLGFLDAFSAAERVNLLHAEPLAHLEVVEFAGGSDRWERRGEQWSRRKHGSQA
ncbi:MAG: hypothetical protein U0228_07090 [Myxococcaceae bacterium]